MAGPQKIENKIDSYFSSQFHQHQSLIIDNFETKIRSVAVDNFQIHLQAIKFRHNIYSTRTPAKSSNDSQT